LLRGRDQADSGVVYEYVRASVPLEDLPGEMLDDGFVDKITGKAERMPAIRFDGFRGLCRLVQVDDGKPVTSLCEQLRRATANALRSSGYDCGASGFHIVLPSFQSLSKLHVLTG
jgi:hypothetical protein